MDKLGFCSELAALIEAGRAVGKSGRIYEHLAAISTVNNLDIIHRLMMEVRAKRTLEVGLSFGGSALAFCASHRELGHHPNRQHVAIDPFQTTHWDSCGLLALERAGLAGYLDFRPFASSSELPRLGSSCFGLIYVDGSHLFEDVFVDAYFGTRLLETGGVIAFDDCSDPHVAKVIAYLKTMPGLNEIELRSSLKHRIGRMLNKVQMRAFKRTGEIERAWDAPFTNF